MVFRCGIGMPMQLSYHYHVSSYFGSTPVYNRVLNVKALVGTQRDIIVSDGDCKSMSWFEPAHDTRPRLAATRHINQATDGNYVAAVSHLNKHKSQPCHERSEGGRVASCRRIKFSRGFQTKTGEQRPAITSSEIPHNNRV